MTETDSKILLTTDDLKVMDDELARVEEGIVSLEDRREKILSQRSKVYELLAALGKAVPNAGVPQTRIVQGKLKDGRTIRVSRAGNMNVGGVTWMSEISRLLSDERDGMTYEDLRAGINLGPLAERLKQSDKGLYGGVAKLEARGELTKHNGRLFDPDHHADFLRRVAVGLVEDTPHISQQTRPSPMAEAIFSLLVVHPSGVDASEIVKNMKDHPQFSEVVSKNKTSVYNVLKRMIDRDQIRKEGKTYFAIRSDDPPENKSGAAHDRS